MDISNIYSKTLELEGLLLLMEAQDAGSEKAQHIYAALKDKIAEISGDIDMMQLRHFSRPMPIEEAEIRQEDDDAAVEQAEIQADEAEAEEAVNDDAEEEMLAEAETEAAETEEAAHEETASTEDETALEDTEIQAESELQREDAECVAVAAAQLPDEDKPQMQDGYRTDTVEIVVAQHPVDVNQSTFARATNGDIRKAFTLNDTYKFRRELFANSQAEFKDALDKVECMTSTVEADDYFYGHLDFDKDSEEVKDFMNIIYAYLSGK